LTGTLPPGKEGTGVKEGVTEVSEMMYGTEAVNREKVSFHLRTNTNQMKPEDDRLKIS